MRINYERQVIMRKIVFVFMLVFMFVLGLVSVHAQERNYTVEVSGQSNHNASSRITATYTISATSSADAEERGKSRFLAENPRHTIRLFASAFLTQSSSSYSPSISSDPWSSDNARVHDFSME